MGYNALQDASKQCSLRIRLKVVQKFFVFLKGVIRCYNVLQKITMRYKRLQKLAMYTTFKIAQEVFFLKEEDKLF